MEEYTLGNVEGRFADIIWEKEPVSVSDLIKICEKEFQWKRTTTYTVLKRLDRKGLFRNQGGVVTSLVSRQEFYARQSEQFVESSFGGSLPGFLAAFTTRKRLSDKEIEEIKEIIESCGTKEREDL